MRNVLVSAAVAPLLLAAGGAAAQVTVSSSTSTPLATSTANAGAPANIDVASGGSITPTVATPAITLDSNNTVSVEGSLSANNVSGSTGVLVLGGHSGSVATTGAITQSEDYAASDSSNSDGFAEAPFAQGTGRYGLRLTGTDAFTGAITLGGAVTVKGNASYGVSLEAPLAGALTVTGALALTGDGGVGVQETGGVSGAITLGSSIAATGQGARAVLVGGDVGGALRLGGAISVSGYATSARQTDAIQAKIQATATDVQQAGAAVTVAGSVAGGVYLSAPSVGTVTGTTADLDADGVEDGSETTGSIAIYGSAPALLVGASGKAITLGNFGTGDNAYGLLLRGSVAASGVEDGVTATAIQVGTGDGTVDLGGGARIVGAVGASAYEADAIGLHVLSGVAAPNLVVNGSLGASVLDSTLITTPTVATATGLLIDAGAKVGSLVNTGTISANTTGDAMGAVAVRDRSGTLSSVVNEGLIGTATTPLTVGAIPSGGRTALDLSANTTGVTLVQQTNPSPNVTYGSTSGTADTAVTTVTATVPAITGNVVLGNGPNSVSLLAGTLQGDLVLGSGENSSLTIDGGAVLTGGVTYGGGSLALNVANGTLDDSSPTALHLSSLNIGASGKVYFSVDGANGRATQLIATGAATIATGATLDVRLLTLPTAAQSYVVVSSPQLSYGGPATFAAASSSYLFNANFAADTTAGTITLALSRKSAADLGLTASESGSLDGVLSGIKANPNLLAATLAPTDKAGFTAIYDQLLPDHSGAIFLAAQSAAQSIGEAATDPRDTDVGPGAWIQQFGIGLQQDRDAAVKSEATGFGVAGGAETGDAGFGQIGVSAAFVNANADDPDLSTASQASFTELEGGLYWRKAYGGLKLSGRVGAGYLYGYDRRYVSVAAGDANSAISTAGKGTWNGWTLDGRIAAAYQLDFGRWFVRPQVAGDYFRLDQDGYTEKGGGDGVDLIVDSRSGDATSGTASVVFGARFGRDLVWRPSLEVGARDVFSGDAGTTTARFVSGGDGFSLVSNPITGVGGIAKAGLKVGGAGYEFFLDATGQVFDKYREGQAKVGVRVLF